MVIDIPQVEPFAFQASTAFDERVQLADKLNEVIDALNLVGDIPDIQTEIDTLKQNVASLQESIGSTDTNLATVEGNLNKTISDLNALTGRVSALETTVSGQTSDIAENASEIAGLKSRMDTAENGIEANKSDIDTIEAKQTEHETEIQGLLREVVDGVAMSSTAHGTVQVTINHEDGTQDTSAPIDLGLVQEGGITLSTGATDRSFRLTVQLSDGSSWQTNDFVIPEGGGTEVVVTSIQIKKGSQDDMMKVSIGLSDGSSIDSNDWSFVTPAQFAALQSTVSTNTGNITSLTGRVTAIDSQLDTIDGSLDSLGDRVTALEGSPGYSLPVATDSVLGGVKIGGNITVQADGTISIPIAGSALGLVKNGGNVVIDNSGKANVDLSRYATKASLVTKADISMVTDLGNDLAMMDSRVSALEGSGSTEFNPDDYDVYFGPSGTDIVAKIVEKSTVQTTDPSLNLSSDNNTMSLQAMLKNSAGSKTIVGTSETPIINSVSGSVTNGKLKIVVNGVESGDIPLPESELDSDITTYPYNNPSGPILIRMSETKILAITTGGQYIQFRPSQYPNVFDSTNVNTEVAKLQSNVNKAVIAQDATKTITTIENDGEGFILITLSDTGSIVQVFILDYG